MVARAPALFNPVIGGWQARLAAVKRGLAAHGDDSFRAQMRSRVLGFLISTYSTAHGKYAPPVELVDVTPPWCDAATARVPLHPLLARVALAIGPVQVFRVKEPDPQPRRVPPPLPYDPEAYDPRFAPRPAPAAPTPPAPALPGGLILRGPIPRRCFDDVVVILSFHLQSSRADAHLLCKRANDERAVFIPVTPEVGERILRHLERYPVKATLQR